MRCSEPAHRVQVCNQMPSGAGSLSLGLGIPTMKLLLTLFLVVALLPLCSCASRSRSRQMIEQFFTEPKVPSTYSTNALRLGYVVAYIAGFNSFMAERGNRPDPYAT